MSVPWGYIGPQDLQLRFRLLGSVQGFRVLFQGCG